MVVASKAVLFDLDGTIMKAGGAGRRALAGAAARLWDIPIEHAREAADSIDYRGNTDARILAELVGHLGRSPQTSADLLRAYVEELDRVLDASTVELMPGVINLLHLLERRPQTRVGLLTGNIREGARRKLARIDLAQMADGLGGFGDDAELRRDIAAVAMQRLAALGVAPWGTLIIGDTEHDVRAAHGVGAPAVAVATGWTERTVLEECGAQLVLDDLSDPGPILDLLERL